MKSIIINSKFKVILILFSFIFLITVIIMGTIKIEDSVKSQVTVDKNKTTSVIVNSSIAYRVKSESTIILKLNLKIEKIEIESMDILKGGKFILNLNISDEKLLPESVIDAWIIFGSKSLISLMLDF